MEKKAYIAELVSANIGKDVQFYIGDHKVVIKPDPTNPKYCEVHFSGLIIEDVIYADLVSDYSDEIMIALGKVREYLLTAGSTMTKYEYAKRTFRLMDTKYFEPLHRVNDPNADRPF